MIINPPNQSDKVYKAGRLIATIAEPTYQIDLVPSGLYENSQLRFIVDIISETQRELCYIYWRVAKSDERHYGVFDRWEHIEKVREVELNSNLVVPPR